MDFFRLVGSTRWLSSLGLLSAFLVGLPPLAHAQDPSRPAQIALPGLIEAEDFDGIAGTVERRVVSSTEAGVGQAVVPTSTTVSLDYPVNVAAAGIYNVKVRYAHILGETLRLSISQDGSASLGTTALSGTGSEENFQTRVINNVQMPAGDQTLTVTLEGDGQGGVLVNWLYLEPVRSTAAADITIAVDPQRGADANSGAPAAPFQTLQRAFDRVAEINADDTDHGPIDVILEDGYHEITSTLQLTADHAGTAAGPIRVRAAAGRFRPMRSNWSRMKRSSIA